MLGRKINMLRKKKGITLKELGEFLNLGESTMSLYENGKRSPDYDTLRNIADYFQVTIDYLLGQNTEPANQVTEALADDPDLQAFWDTMKEREDLQLMFKKTKELSPAAIKQIIGIIKLIEDREDEEFGE